MLSWLAIYAAPVVESCRRTLETTNCSMPVMCSWLRYLRKMPLWAWIIPPTSRDVTIGKTFITFYSFTRWGKAGKVDLYSALSVVPHSLKALRRIGVAAYTSGTAFTVPLSIVVRQQYTFAVPLFRQQDSICVIADFANLIFLKHQMLDSVVEMSVIYSAHSQVWLEVSDYNVLGFSLHPVIMEGQLTR